MSFLKLQITPLLFILILVFVNGFSSSKYFNVRRRCSPSPIRLQLSSGYDEEGESSASTGKRRRPARIRPTRPPSSTVSIEQRRDEARKRHKEALQDPTLLTKLNFADRTDIHPAVKRAITEVLGLTSMTQIQAKTYEKALAGENILGRSRTGTGKTLAYLLPTIERLLEFDAVTFRPGRQIGVIIIAPTRELAIQIADQATNLVTFLNDVNVACIYGGTKMSRDLRLLSGGSGRQQEQLPSILVCTPGRIMEHLENTKVGRRKFCDIIQETNMVVLDEADRLFENFPKETSKILSYLPRVEKRQTLFFSATVPSKFRYFLKNTMKIQCSEIDCVQEGGTKAAQSETNIRAQHYYYHLKSMDEYISRLVDIIQQETDNERDHKIIVFFPAGRLVRFFAQIFNVGFGINVLEIHSRMSQASRNRASNTFREARRGILFTSDVSARGIDYPQVSLVLQYGAPVNKDSYIHRLGRTARAGKKGRGLLVLLPWEQLANIRKLDILPDSSMKKSLTQSTNDLLEELQSKIRSGHVILTPNAEAAYRAFLAHYITMGEIEATEVLEYANQFASSTGLSDIPPIESKVAARLGLEGLVKEI